ncbi:MAG: hypothetical protein IKP37_09660 [Paludibacteraceae bacterium]|nr:hypothetical protein [Paludibacteraceae bacterium]
MKTSKEYPATHSMSTAWFVIDEEDNVALFEGADNGPVPNGLREERFIDELIFRDGVQEVNGEKFIDFSEEQASYWVENLLDPNFSDWKSCWDIILQIDPDRKDVYLSYKPDSIRLNAKYGLYYSGNGYLPKILLEEKIVLKATYCPYWNEPLSNIEVQNHSCPFFLYENEWNFRFPFVRANIPLYPVKASQLSLKQLKQSVRLPIKFNEREKIQVMPLYPCYSYCSEYENHILKGGYPYVEVFGSLGEPVYALDYYADGEENIKALKNIPLTLSLKEVDNLKK